MAAPSGAPSRGALATDTVVLAGSAGLDLAVQIRHRGQAVPCGVIDVSADGRTLRLAIRGELQAAARGQSGVVLVQDQVLGGGVIRSARGPAKEAHG